MFEISFCLHPSFNEIGFYDQQAGYGNGLIFVSK